MYLREAQHHLTNPELAKVYQTLFDDTIVAKEDVVAVKQEIFSYDKFVKDTVVAVVILRAEIENLDGETDVETLGFCYPRALENKIIDATNSKAYETVFKVPNGIKDLGFVEIRNLRLLPPEFSELYTTYFPNDYHYILNHYAVHADPAITFAPQPPLTAEEEAAALEYDKFCIHTLPKYEKAQKSLFAELGKTLSRIPLLYGHFKIKMKDVDDDDLVPVCGAPEPSFDASDYEERLNDHDLYITFTGKKVEDLQTHDFAAYVIPALVKIPYYMNDKDEKIFDASPITDLPFTIDDDLYPRLNQMLLIAEHGNTLVANFVKKWSQYPDLTDKIVNVLNLFLHSIFKKQDLLYHFNNESIVETHLNKVLAEITEVQGKLKVLNPNVELGLDPNSWKLWDYSDLDNPVEVADWALPVELGDHYSDPYLNSFSAYCRFTRHPLIRVYQEIKQVKREDIAKHAIGSVRQERSH